MRTDVKQCKYRKLSKRKNTGKQEKDAQQK